MTTTDMMDSMPVGGAPAALRTSRVIAVDARTLGQTGKGIPRFLFETLRELAKLPDLTLVLFSNRPLHPDNTLPIETVIDRRWSRVPGTVWMMARLNRLARDAGADTVWGPAHVIPPRNRHLRTVLTVHDLVYRLMPQSMGWWNRCVAALLVDSSIRRADHVVADSEATRDDVRSMLGLDDARLRVVHLGARDAPTDLAGQHGTIDRSTTDRNYLFALGSIEPRKNIDGLLDCFDALRRRDPTLSLRLTGAHHWGSTETLDRIRTASFCRMLGFLSDREIAEQMAGARAFVMPSHYEGFGLPIIEAVGLAPIIAADIPVFRELGRFIDGIRFVDFADAEQAARSIASFLATSPPPARFVPGAERHFRWDEVAGNYAEILRSPDRGSAS